MPSRGRSFRVDAVILRHSDWGEADRLLWLYTREFGKMRAIAKGVRKIRSRKAGHLEPFMHTTLLLARGRNTYLVTQAETLDAFNALREDLLWATAASYVVELLDRFTHEEVEIFRSEFFSPVVPQTEQAVLFRLLLVTLDRIATAGRCKTVSAIPASSRLDAPGNVNQLPSNMIELAVRYYEIRLLDIVGFRPQLFSCLGCAQEIQPQDQFFSAQYGGVFCPNCGREIREAKPITTNVLRYLRHFQRSEWNQVVRAPFSSSLNREIETIIQYYLTYLLERGLNTPAFMRRVREIGYTEKE